jgi:hypothetical protein
MGGSGKSVLAAAFARLTETRRAFPDGVAWISYGESTAVRDALRQAGNAFAGTRGQYEEEPSAIADLTVRLETLRCLLVIDNASELAHIEPFAAALGARGRLLVTTRNAGVATSLGANAVALGELSEDAALVHLADWAGTTPEALPAEARDVAKRSGGLPLATALCGAMASQGTAWSDLLTKLNEADLAFLAARFPNYPHPSMLHCLKVSIDLLAPAERDRYAELRIFALTEPPAQVVVRLWTRGDMMSAADARQLIVSLKLRALVRVDGSDDSQRITLHDLQHDLLRSLYPATDTVHAGLVESYKKTCGGDWVRGPEDGYYFQNIVLHLLLSRQRGEAIQLVTGTDRWFQIKRSRPRHQTGLNRDIELCQMASPSLVEMAGLCAVRHLVRYAAANHRDVDLKTLVLVDRSEEALNQAKLRGEPKAIAEGLLATVEAGVTDASVIDEIDSTISELPDPIKRAGLLARLASILPEEQRTRARALAAEILNQPLPDKQTEAWSDLVTASHQILPALLRTGQLRAALQWIDATSDERWRNYFLRQLGVAAAAAKSSAMTDVLARIRASNSDDTKALALADIAGVLARGGDLSLARQLVKHAEATVDAAAGAARVRILARLAEVHALLGDPAAETLFNRAESGIASIRGVDRHGLERYVANALASSGNFAESRRLAALHPNDHAEILYFAVSELVRRERLDDAAGEADSIESVMHRAAAFSEIAFGFARAGQKERAADYLRRAIESRQLSDAASHKISALTRTAEAVLQQDGALAYALLDAAIQTVPLLPKQYDYSDSLKDIVVCCCRTGNLDVGERLLDSISNDIRRKESAAEVAQALAASRNVKDGEILARARLQDDDLFSCLARIYQNAGRWKEAEGAADRIERDYDRIVALAQLASAMARAGDVRAAVLFRKAHHTAKEGWDQWMGEGFQRTALAAIVSALVACSWMEEAWETAQSMDRGPETANARLEVVAVNARAGNQSAISLLRDLRQQVEAQRERGPFLSLLPALARGGLADDALAIAARLLRETDLARHERWVVCESLAEAGHLALAIRHLDVDRVDSYLWNVASLVIKAGAVEGVIEQSIRIIGWVRPDWRIGAAGAA